MTKLDKNALSYLPIMLKKSRDFEVMCWVIFACRSRLIDHLNTRVINPYLCIADSVGFWPMHAYRQRAALRLVGGVKLLHRQAFVLMFLVQLKATIYRFIRVEARRKTTCRCGLSNCVFTPSQRKRTAAVFGLNTNRSKGL